MASRMIKTVSALLLLSVIVGCDLMGGGTNSGTSVTGVSLNKTTVTITVGGTDQLTAFITPDNASNRAVTWASDNPSVATVSANGLVTALAPGSVTIAAKTSDGGHTAECNVIAAFAGLPANSMWTPGSLSGGCVWYEAAVTGGQPHILMWDESYPGSGAYYASIFVSAYQEDRSTPYFTGEDSGYATGKNITVPSGQTKLYVKVDPAYQGFYGTFAVKLIDTSTVGGATVTID